MISFSGLERFVKCPASAALAQATTDSTPARRGTFLHKYVELFRASGHKEAMDWARANAEDSDWIIAADSIPIELFDRDLDVEVAFAMHTASSEAMLLGSRIDRNYDVPEGFIPGTADLVGIGPDSVYIGDWKFGQSWLPPVMQSFQLRALALCAMRVYGKEKAVIEHIICREGRPPYRDHAETDLFELEAEFEPLVRNAWVKYQEAVSLRQEERAPNVNEGDHCTYCPARYGCPAKTALATRIGTGKELTEWKALQPISRKNAADAWVKCEMLMSYIKSNVMPALHAMIREEALELADGTFVAEVERPGNEKLDPQLVYEETLKALGEKAANMATPRTATKSNLKRAAKDSGVKGYTRVVDEIVDKVRERGGATKPMRTSIKRVKERPHDSRRQLQGSSEEA